MGRLAQASRFIWGYLAGKLNMLDLVPISGRQGQHPRVLRVAETLCCNLKAEMVDDDVVSGANRHHPFAMFAPRFVEKALRRCILR
jgi:hypothetical protein